MSEAIPDYSAANHSLFETFPTLYFMGPIDPHGHMFVKLESGGLNIPVFKSREEAEQAVKDYGIRGLVVVELTEAGFIASKPRAGSRIVLMRRKTE